MFKRTCELTEEEKRKVSEMCGNIMLWIIKGDSVIDMAHKLRLEPWQVESNINEMLYTLRKSAGIKRYIKYLFIK